MRANNAVLHDPTRLPWDGDGRVVVNGGAVVLCSECDGEGLNKGEKMILLFISPFLCRTGCYMQVHFFSEALLPLAPFLPFPWQNQKPFS